MFNNVIDHSGASEVTVSVLRSAAQTKVEISDNGAGIFKKIQHALNLDDARHAVLELAKGKFTTDPKNHSGEGIFFSSRMFDGFAIRSGDVYFSHDFDEKEDWILPTQADLRGTFVHMALGNHTTRTAKKISDKFSSGDDYGFTTTVVPVRLMQYGDENLLSRSQAKRLLSRFDRFKVVILDFAGVAMIGQSFADEIFRVFSLAHSEIELVVTNATSDVKRMIARAKALGLENPGVLKT
jgi:STAS-like domain of unknown function (DUF4325)